MKTWQKLISKAGLKIQKLVAQAILNLVAKRFVTLVVFLVLLFLLTWAVGFKLDQSVATYAQDSPSNLKSLLIDLNNKIVNENGFTFSLGFDRPMVDGESQLTLPKGTTQDEIRISIDNIGDDFLCLEELRGVALLMRCIPFTNIVSVTYLDE